MTDAPVTFCVAKQWLLSHMPEFDKHFMPPSVTVGSGQSMFDDNIAFTLMAVNASHFAQALPLCTYKKLSRSLSHHPVSHSLTRSLNYSLVPSITRSFTHSSIQLLTHSFTHPRSPPALHLAVCFLPRVPCQLATALLCQVIHALLMRF